MEKRAEALAVDDKPARNPLLDIPVTTMSPDEFKAQMALQIEEREAQRKEQVEREAAMVGAARKLLFSDHGRGMVEKVLLSPEKFPWLDQGIVSVLRALTNDLQSVNKRIEKLQAELVSARNSFTRLTGQCDGMAMVLLMKIEEHDTGQGSDQ